MLKGPPKISLVFPLDRIILYVVAKVDMCRYMLINLDGLPSRLSSRLGACLGAPLFPALIQGSCVYSGSHIRIDRLSSEIPHCLVGMSRHSLPACGKGHRTVQGNHSQALKCLHCEVWPLGSHQTYMEFSHVEFSAEVRSKGGYVI